MARRSPLLAALLACGPALPPPLAPGAEVRDPVQVRVATWNVHDLFDAEDRVVPPGDEDLVPTPEEVDDLVVGAVGGSALFASTFTRMPGKDARTSRRSGGDTPRPRQGKVRPASGVKPNPASRARTSASVRASIVPGDPVRRVVSSSWKTITSPSAVRCTSVSNASAPRRAACSKAGRVFSGRRRAPPRCATSQGRRRAR